MIRLLSFTVVLLFFVDLSAQQLTHVQGDIIIKITPEANIYELVSTFQTLNRTNTRLRVNHEVSQPMRAWLISFDFTRVDENMLLRELRRHPSVEIAQFNHYLRQRETYPNDPFFPAQWQWLNTGQNGGRVDADMDAELAWDITTGGLTSSGDTIVVCVVEGTNRSHPDLQGNLWYNWNEIPGNGIDDDNNGYIDDFNGWNVTAKNDNIPSQSHGTAVSGVIGAVGNNSLGVTGLNWRVKIMHVDFAGITEANVMMAYTYPWIMRRLYNQTQGAKGAFIVASNSSWGLDNTTASAAPLWCAFYDSLGMVGILSCVATTNNNVDVDKVGDMPSSCTSEFMIAVTATNRNDSRTFAGYGPKAIDVAAPGSNIGSLTLSGAPSSSSGTSFATPMVAGLAALLYSSPCSYLGNFARKNPAEAALYVRDAIFNGVDFVSSLQNEVKYKGRVNAFNSLIRIMDNCGPCPQPLAIKISAIIDTTALISWLTADSTLSTSLRFRKTGDTLWTRIDSVISPYRINKLAACNAYELQLLENCKDTTSGFTSSFLFKTDGCCEPPAALVLSKLKDTSVTASWDFVLAAKSYNLLLKSDSTSLLLEGLKESKLNLTKLLPCTKYSLQVQTVCDTGLTAFSPLVEFRTFGCGPCIDSTYCFSRGENAQQEWIKNVALHTLNNTSGSNQGYGDFTGIAVDLLTYKAYQLSLTPGFQGAALNEWFSVWIDFNQDGDFSDLGEEVYDSKGITNKAVTAQIVIPGTAVPGLTRMRVSMRWNQKPLPCTPAFNFGEVEDYCINIVKGSIPLCIPPDSLSVSNINYTSASLEWKGNEEALTYEIRFRKSGAAQWMTLASLSNLRALTDLEPCAEYEVELSLNCIGVKGAWSKRQTFKTRCYPVCDEVPGGLIATTLNDSSINLQWNGVMNALSYKLNYKLQKDSLWKTIQTDKLAYILSGLDSCSSYHFSVQALCLGGRASEHSKIFEFRSVCSVNTLETESPFVAFRVQPNPFSHNFWIEFSLKKGSVVTWELYNPLGQKLLSSSRYFDIGAHLIPIRLAQDEGVIAAGVYLIKLGTGNEWSSYKILKQ